MDRCRLTSSHMRCTFAATHQLMTSARSSGVYTMPCSARRLQPMW